MSNESVANQPDHYTGLEPETDAPDRIATVAVRRTAFKTENLKCSDPFEDITVMLRLTDDGESDIIESLDEAGEPVVLTATEALLARDHAKLQSRIALHLEAIAGMEGEVVYSPHTTLGPGKFYVVGLNPGGRGQPHPETGDNYTIQTHVERMVTRVEHSYQDEIWENKHGKHPKGEAVLQKTMCAVLRDLGQSDIRSVFTTNLIFKTTPSDKDLDDFKHLAEVCWRVHEWFLELVQPSVILCVGNGEEKSAYAYVRQKLDGTGERTGELKPGKRRCKVCTVHHKGRSILLMGLPHLSLFTLRPDEVEWVKEKVEHHLANGG